MKAIPAASTRSTNLAFSNEAWSNSFKTKSRRYQVQHYNTREKAISGMDTLGSRLLGNFNDAIHAQIGVLGKSCTHTISLKFKENQSIYSTVRKQKASLYLIRQANMHRSGISVAVDGHSFHAKLLRSANNTTSNLSTIGNKDLIKRLLRVSMLSTSQKRCSASDVQFAEISLKRTNHLDASINSKKKNRSSLALIKK